MFGNTVTSAFEGGFATRNPFASVIANAGALTAGPNGVTIGRFGYQEPATGQVSSTRSTLTQKVGFVLPQWGTWNKIYSQEGTWILREGLMVTLAAKGDFWCRFMGGAFPGEPVYASWVDGSALTVPIVWTADELALTADSIFTADGAASELTQWVVASFAPPGGLAVITPYATYSAAN